MALNISRYLTHWFTLNVKTQWDDEAGSFSATLITRNQTVHCITGVNVTSTLCFDSIKLLHFASFNAILFTS